jgi:hypothetical protein
MRSEDGRFGDDLDLRVRADLPPPPAGPELTAALGALAPVRTRVPLRALLVLIGVQVVCAAVVLGSLGQLRPDIHALPLPWVVAMGLLFAVAGPFLLARATLPAPGQVLPDPARAGRSALAVAFGLVLLGLFATVDADGVTAVPSSFFGAWWHCTKFALRLTLPVLLGGAVLLRHLHPIGAPQIGAAIGAAGGAWAGFVLHLVCPLGGGAHVGLAHGGAAVVGAALGAGVLAGLLR